MEINRRQCLALLASSMLLPVTASGNTSVLMFASATQDKEKNHWLTLVDDQGTLLLQHALPNRAHHVAAHPDQSWLMAVARRPDRFIDIVDYQQKVLIKRIEPDTDRHFFGHAVFSANGDWLVCTENQISTGEGRVVIRDCRNNFAVLADYPSYGIGPHELLWAPDNRTLVIANGGILTHPDKGRKKLNLTTMQPNLSYIDSQNGKLLAQVQLPDEMHQLSIRHIDVNQQGLVAIAMQYQGAAEDVVPLVGLHQQGQTKIQLLTQPEAVRQKMKQYCGSVRFDSSGQYVAVSSPRGDLINVWQANGQFKNSLRVADGCGVAATHQAGNFLISSGRGRCYHYSAISGQKQKLPLDQLAHLAWDNHMSLVS